MEKQLVPQLRFPVFQTKISYHRYIFENIFKFSTGKNIKQTEASPDFEIPCVRYGELYHMYNEVIHEIINKTNLDKSELLFSKGDEILLPSAGEDPLDIGSASALTIKNIAIGRTINILRPIKNDIYCNIYASYFINQKLRKKISTLAKGSSISNVYNSDLRKLKIVLPSLPEQQKIASFLTDIDTKITQLTKKKSLLEQYKKGIMQKIFNQELRFRDDDGNEFPEWTEKKLGGLVKKAQSGGTPKSTNKSYYNGNIPFLSISDMTEQGKYLKHTTKSISQLGIVNSSTWLVPKNSIIYSMYASVGFVSINKIELATSQAVMNIILKEGINIEYIYYYLVDFRKNINKFIETGTQGNINASIVRNIKIKIPRIEEQTKIANFLSDIDLKIEALHTKIENTKTFKKGLLQQMFV